jgi:hypothetical protein
MTNRLYPQDFATWSEDQRNQFFAQEAREYREQNAKANGQVKRNGHAHGEQAEEPLPLFPPLPEAAPYPIDALGPVLSPAAKAIERKVQVPEALAARSVLAAASLATSAHADVALPYGQTRPLSLYFLTVAASGDRKSTADNEALWPVRKRELALKEEYAEAMKVWRIENAAWAAEKRKIESNSKIDFAERWDRLAALGPELEKPLEPLLVSGDLTLEGLVKAWPNLHPALGNFTAEGGMFAAGHAMNDDNRLRSAAMLSELWDEKPVRRIRALVAFRSFAADASPCT